jgi:hypothetical protein
LAEDENSSDVKKTPIEKMGCRDGFGQSFRDCYSAEPAMIWCFAHPQISAAILIAPLHFRGIVIFLNSICPIPTV